MQSVLDIMVSYFRTKGDKDPKPRPLVDVLRDRQRVEPVARIRQLLHEQGKVAYDLEKPQQPCFLVSVVAEGGHHADYTKGVTGLMAVDIDAKDNPGWTTQELKGCLAQCRNVAYCGLSLSGAGVWCIIPIADPEKHLQHFYALQRLFIQLGEWKKGKGYGIVIDKQCKNPNRLRFHSYDPAPVWRDNAEPLTVADQPKPKAVFNRATIEFAGSEGEVLRRCTKLVESASEGERHEKLLKAAMVAGGYIAGNCLSEGLAVAALETIVSEWPNFRKSQGTIQDGIRMGKDKPLYADVRTLPAQTPRTQQPPVTIKSLSEWQPGQIATVDESRVERLSVTPTDDYPPEWDEPDPPDATPTIKPVQCRSSYEFHKWQRQHTYFSQMGINSLNQSTI